MIRWFKKESRALRQKITTRVLVISLAVTAVAVSGTVLMADWTGNTSDIYTMGRVAIGMNSISTSRSLVVKSTGHDDGIFLLNSSNGNNLIDLKQENQRGRIILWDGNNNMNINLDAGSGGFIMGWVGIGTRNPNSELTVAGITTSTSYACSSDARYKKDVTLFPNALAKVLGLRGVNYFWRTDEFKDKNFSKDKQIGFIAQEVEKVIPELVYTDSKGYKTMSYDRLTAVLVEAVKELKAQSGLKISALEKENAELKQRLAKLDSMADRLAKLEVAVGKTELAQK